MMLPSSGQHISIYYQTGEISRGSPLSLGWHAIVLPGPAYARPADSQALCFWHSEGCIPAGGHLEPEPALDGECG